MINLIGWAVGNALARQAEASKEDINRLSLLGAASPSPLLGAVLVSAALRQDNDEDDKHVARDEVRRAVEGEGNVAPAVEGEDEVQRAFTAAAAAHAELELRHAARVDDEQSYQEARRAYNNAIAHLLATIGDG
jgi:hypothetical protein